MSFFFRFFFFFLRLGGKDVSVLVGDADHDSDFFFPKDLSYGKRINVDV